jgi:hypothetical protein
VPFLFKRDITQTTDRKSIIVIHYVPHCGFCFKEQMHGVIHSLSVLIQNELDFIQLYLPVTFMTVIFLGAVMIVNI